MTDIFVACAREDRERVRPVADLLRQMGWDVWFEPGDPFGEPNPVADTKLARAGAILVMWSEQGRRSENVRSEAATGLYKNKLVQVRLDGGSPPRPFDQVDAVDLSRWMPGSEDASWRKLVTQLRNCAGEPIPPRPAKTAAPPPPPPQPPPIDDLMHEPLHRRAVPTYRVPEERRSERLPHVDLGGGGGGGGGVGGGVGGGGGWVGPAMVVGAVALIASGVGIWVGDPFSWRTDQGSETLAMAARSVPDAPIIGGEPATSRYEDTDASDDSWRRVDRKNPDALRDHMADHPAASTTATARAALRVLDAQAWVSAVTDDTESAYRAYLDAFPSDASLPGAMAAAASARLAELDTERVEAIEEIQRGLATAGLYTGAVNGETNAATTAAVRTYAQSKRRTAPALATAAPRDLRAFAATLSGASTARETSAAVAAAQEADARRLAQAQAASMAASVAATQPPVSAPGAAPGASVDTLAVAQQRRIAESEAWEIAERANTLEAYRIYVAAWPDGANASDARAAVAKLSRPAPFSIDQLAEDVKGAVDAARRAQTTASQRAAAARQAASSADSLTDAQSIVGADGDRYTAQISGGAPNGLGVRVRGSGVNAGDRYRGELRNGQRAGVGVYEFGDNPGNAGARALRYEGEHAGDAASGHGVMLWRSGDTFAGLGAGGGGASRGVLTYDNGLRYEGELVGGQRQGLGVVWSADGEVVQAGRWARDDLAEPMKR